jgi:transposase InsO family protein
MLVDRLLANLSVRVEPFVLCQISSGWRMHLPEPPAGCIHHTDRGSQCCAHDYQKLLCKHGLKASMSGKGNCYDNSAVESFLKSLKAELVWRRNWQMRRDVEIGLFEYINGFYNPRRKHSALGWKSPVAFEQKAA